MSALNQSQNFYQHNAQAYFDQTAGVDPSSFLQPLVDCLQPGAKVLDIGCGSGRDLRWLASRGFAALGLDRASGLAQLARRHAACEVVLGDFKHLPFVEGSFDGLLMMGALVHVDHAELPALLGKIFTLMGPQAYALLSLKEGVGFRQDHDDRVFCLWQVEPLKEIFFSLKMQVIDSDRHVSMIRKSDTWLTFLLRKMS